MLAVGYGSLLLLLQFFVAAPGLGQTPSPACDDATRGSEACLPWGYVDLQPVLGDHWIFDLSKDGSVVAIMDSSFSSVGRWKLGTGPQLLAGDYTLSFDRPVMSENGSVIVGSTDTGGTPQYLSSRVFRWDAENNTSPVILPTGPAHGISDFNDPEDCFWYENGTIFPSFSATISGDGNTITGTGQAMATNTRHRDDPHCCYNRSPCPPYSPYETLYKSHWTYRWTAAGGTNDAPQQSFSPERFFPDTIAGNGLRIAGTAGPTDGLPDGGGAALWAPGLAMSLLPDAWATTISFDGQHIGIQDFLSTSDSRSWLSSQGTLIDIPNAFWPETVSDDGTVIAGWQWNVNQPWVWKNGAPVTDESLLDYLFGNFGLTNLGPFGTGGFQDRPQAFGISSGDGHVFTVEGAQWVANVRPLNVVALGDSYSSGEGAISPGEQYRSGTDSAGPPRNRCHRSNTAYAAVAQAPTSLRSFRELAANRATEFTWDFIACSGARTYHVISNGIRRFPTELPQLAQNKVDGDTDLVTITIGGNDALFSLVLSACAKNSLSSNCFDEIYPGTTDTFRDLLEMRVMGSVTDRVVEVYEEIKSESMDNATVVALGYPLLLSGTSGCLGAPGITNDERNKIRDMGILLNEQLAIAARRAGVHFVHEVAAAFERHNVCDSQPWIRGIHLGPTVHWFHPTADGQLAYARVLEEFFRKKARLAYAGGFFASGMPRNPVPVP